MAYSSTTFQHGVEGMGSFEDSKEENENHKLILPIPRLLPKYERETTPTLNPAALWSEQTISKEHHPPCEDEFQMDTEICC